MRLIICYNIIPVEEYLKGNLKASGVCSLESAHLRTALFSAARFPISAGLAPPPAGRANGGPARLWERNVRIEVYCTEVLYNYNPTSIVLVNARA